MHGRLHVHGQAVAEIDLAVPVHGSCRQPRHRTRQDRIVAERRNDARAEVLPNSADHLRIHVIVVIVRDEHRVDTR
jgi:hypothetical protein